MFLFGKLKSTAKIEQERKQLSDDYQKYTEIEDSKKLKDFLVLKEKVESTSFQSRKKEVESLQYKGSPEEKLMKQFSELEKNPKLIGYLQSVGSAELKRFKKLKEQGLSEKHNELEQFVKTGKYQKELNEFNQKKKSDKDFKGTWESTEAYKKHKEFEDLKASDDFNFYSKFKNSSSFKNYLSINESSLLNQYEDMKKEVTSDKFKKRVAYLEDKDRYKKTDDYEDLLKFHELEKDPGIQLYFKYHGSNDFKFFREWTPSFVEEFDKKLNKEIWSSIIPIAEKGPGQNFSVKGQLQCYNNYNNFEVDNSILTLDTHAEKIDGFYWDEELGFRLKSFDYTSGILHSLDQFKQEYGLFEVKMKASKIKGVITSISLVTEIEDECIRLISVENYKASGGIIYTDHDEKLFSKLSLKFKPNGYVIVGVEWSPERIEWKVNDKVMGSITQKVPHEKMGLRIESVVVKPSSNLPHRLDIDWIKCYKRKK
jgi:hypothetical protein